MTEQVIVVDLFKETFKRYKKKNADLSDAIDLSRHTQLHRELIRLQDPVISTANEAARLGLVPTDKWKIYSLLNTPGLLLIPNPFVEGCQQFWVRRCLVDYPCLPNVCNLDTHARREGTGQVWPDGQEEGGDKDDLLYKLRWTTLGYHYDWNTKKYYEDRMSPFPSDLAQLSAFILKAAGFPGFTAEAGIVNYYHLDSTLSGHTDHSERDLSLPLLSISFGQSAVFLVGGETKSVQPQAIVLHSGDVVVMSGASRLAYHGVPKILPPPPTTPVPPPLSKQSLLDYLQGCRDVLKRCRLVSSSSSGSLCRVCGPEREDKYSEQTPTECVSDSAVPPTAKRVKTEEEGEGRSGDEGRCRQWGDLLREWPAFEEYISTSRININIRQVNSSTPDYRD